MRVTAEIQEARRYPLSHAGILIGQIFNGATLCER
jgi:hypothetical protein